MPRDEHGEYQEDAGKPHPIDPDDVSYEPCNAVLRHTWSRYGERRYCSGMAVGTFESNDTETNYEHPEFCRHHQSRASLMKQRAESFKTGAYAKSHEHTFQNLPPHKQVLVNDMYKSLLDESEYSEEWEPETVEIEVDVEDHDFAPDVDTLVIEQPIPTNRRIRAKALWFAALDFVTMESIREEQFRVAAEKTFEGRSLAIGEDVEIVTVTDDGREITDTAEHDLNLTLSRIQKDYSEHLAFGGVETEEDGESTDMGAREWVAVVEPDEPEVQPEAKKVDGSGFEDIEVPDSED